jgi:hypothetical protein
MGSGVSTEVSALMGTVKNSKGEDRLEALTRLGELAEDDDEAYKIGLASDELGLVKELASLIAKEREPGGDAQALKLAFVMCANISMNEAAKLKLVSPANNLLPILVKIVGAGGSQVDDEGTAETTKCMTILAVFAGNPETHEHLLSPDLQLLKIALKTFAKEDLPDDLKMMIAMAFMDLAQKLSSCEVMLDQQVPQFIITVLQAESTDPEDWDRESYQNFLVTFLLRFCRLRSGADLIKHLGGASIVDSMCLLGPSVHMFTNAAFASVLISGRDEKDSVLERLPGLLDTVVGVFQNTLEGQGGEGDVEYYFGTYQIPLLVEVLAVLAISDANKSALLENEHVLSLLANVLRRFQENQPEYSGIHGLFETMTSVGGGGKDTESLAKAIEALLQLSFFYAANDDAALRERFLKADTDLVKLLTDTMEMPPSPLNKDARAGLSALLQRLVLLPPRLQVASDKEAEGMVVSTSPSKKEQPIKHVMLSYGE